MNKLGRRVYVDKWADRTTVKPKRKEVPKVRWTEPQDDFLKAACLTTKSFGMIRDDFNKAFPGAAKSRNAIIGRAQREGYSDHKPGSIYKPGSTVVTVKVKGRPRTRVVKKIKYAGQETRRVRRAALAPVVFKPSLRDDNEPILRQSGPHTMKRKTPEQIAQARKGHLPCIVEEQPLTSVAMDQTEADCCKWPTSEDVTCMEVCGAPAEYGAYCERHAMVAYREMPTRRRNTHYARKGMLDDQQRVKERDARMLEEIEVEAPLLGADPAPSLLEFTPGTGRPFNGNKS